jgi:chromosome segregation ATPase
VGITPDGSADGTVQQENETLRSRIEHLESSLTGAEDKLNGLTDCLEESQKARKPLEDEVARCKRQVEEYQIVVMEADDEVESAAKELILQQQQSERLQSELATAQEELRGVSDELSVLQTRFADSQRAVAASEGELVVAAERIAELLEQQEQEQEQNQSSGGGFGDASRALDVDMTAAFETSAGPTERRLLEEVETARTEVLTEREAKLAAEHSLLDATQAAARAAAEAEAAQGELLARAERNSHRALSELRAEGMEAKLELAGETDRANRLANELTSARAQLSSTTAQLASTTAKRDDAESRCQSLAEAASAATGWQNEAARLAAMLSKEHAAHISREEEEALLVASADADAEAALATMHARVASLKRNLGLLTAASVAAGGALVQGLALDAIAAGS